MEMQLKNYSLRSKIIQITSLITFLLCACAKEDPWKGLNEQAFELFKQGRYSEATEVAKEALQLAERTHGPDHPDVATSLRHLILFEYPYG